jgi:hypothetical protein
MGPIAKARYCARARILDSSSEEPDPCLKNPNYDVPVRKTTTLEPGEQPPSIDSASTIPTPSTPDSSNDLVNREKICVLDAFSTVCPFAGIPPPIIGDVEECREKHRNLLEQLNSVLCRNGVPASANISKRLLFDLRDKIQSDISSMKLQLPAKQREFQVYNGTKGTWQSENLSYLLKLAREGRRVAGTPPEAPATNAQRRLVLVERATEKAKLLVGREQRLSNSWRAFLSRFKVLDRKPQVSIDVESSLQRRRLCGLRDQFADLHVARMEYDFYFKTMLGSFKDSRVIDVLLTDVLEKNPGCVPTLPEVFYWLTSYIVVLADGSIGIPCNPPKDFGHPTDVIAQVFQLVKCVGPDVLSDMAKLKKATMALLEAIVGEPGLECIPPLKQV